MRFKLDPSLSEIIRDKRVALVGPSSHLMGASYGKLINSYDVVCRVGELYPCGLEKDYGNRTDIFINCFNNQTPPQIEKEIERAESLGVDVFQHLKCAMCPQLSKDNSGSRIVDNFHQVKKFYDRKLPLYEIGDKYHMYLREVIKTPPNTGVAAIPMLLEYNPAELFITGFSFYHQGDLSSQCYKPGYLGITHPRNPTGHQSEPQLDYFKEVILKKYDEVISVDRYLYELLKVPGVNVQEPAESFLSLNHGTQNLEFALKYHNIRKYQREPFANNFLSFIDDPSKISFLSIGCGFAGEEAHFAGTLGRVVLLDQYPKTIELVEKIYGDLDLLDGVEFIPEYFQNYSPADAFDVIYVSGPSDWVKNQNNEFGAVPEDYARFASTYLKDGGSLILRLYSGDYNKKKQYMCENTEEFCDMFNESLEEFGLHVIRCEIHPTHSESNLIIISQVGVEPSIKFENLDYGVENFEYK